MKRLQNQSAWSLWALGFRPFFLVGSALGTISLAVWLLSYIGASNSIRVDSLWHAHEMIHGFVVSIVIGFLLTASSNWSGKKGLHGPKLAALTIVWLLGRILFLVPETGLGMRAGVDLAFLPFAVALLFPYLKGARHKRNIVFVLLLSFLWSCNLVYHLEALGVWTGYSRKSLLLAIQVIILILVIISGRVIPFFTERAVPHYKRKEGHWFDRLAVASTLIFVLSYVWSEFGLMTFWSAVTAGLLHSIRIVRWFDRGVWRRPILLILYIGYGWLAVAFAISGGAALGIIGSSIATHAFTAGAISVMIVGMMTRVTLGHTGRVIAASRLTNFAYLLIAFGSVARVLGPLLAPGLYIQAIAVAGTLWIGAMTLFLWEYAPMLTSPRIDGRPG